MVFVKCIDCGLVFEAPDKRIKVCDDCRAFRKTELFKAVEKKPKKKFPSIMQVSRVERIYNAVHGTAKHYHEIANIIDSTATDRFVCCGDVIPEGRMVCPNCEQKGR